MIGREAQNVKGRDQGLPYMYFIDDKAAVWSNDFTTTLNNYRGLVATTAYRLWKLYESRGERAFVALQSIELELAKIEAKYHRLFYLLQQVGNYSYTEAMALLQGRECELSLMNGGRKAAIKRVLGYRKQLRPWAQA